MSILKAKNVAIIGASGALGKALVENLSKDDDTKNIFAFSRKKFYLVRKKYKRTPLILKRKIAYLERQIVSLN